jgi:hypothetical protein
MIEEARFNDALSDRHVTGQSHVAARPSFEPGHLPLQRTHGCFNLPGVVQQALALRGQPVTTGLALRQ